MQFELDICGPVPVPYALRYRAFLFMLFILMLCCVIACMRTTIDLPDPLLKHLKHLKHLKARAALEGRTLRDLVVALV